MTRVRGWRFGRRCHLRPGLALLLAGVALSPATGCSDDSGAPAVDASNDDLDAATPPEPWDVLTMGCDTFGSAQRLGRLPEGLVEASGIVMSRTHDRVAWLHNDSSYDPIIYGVNVDSGALVATLRLDGAPARDWEDISLGPCGDGDATCIYVGDIGDNRATHTSVRVHRVPEPATLELDSVTGSFETMRLTYPGGPMDAEAMVVDDAARVWIMGKDPARSLVVMAQFEDDADVVATEHGELPISALGLMGGLLVTGADWHEASARLIVRGYGQVFELRGEPGDGVGDVVSADPIARRQGLELQGEAIAWGPDGYYHVAEGSGAQLWRFVCAELLAQPARRRLGQSPHR